MKKILSLFFALTMLLSICCETALATDASENMDLIETLPSGKVTNGKDGWEKLAKYYEENPERVVVYDSAWFYSFRTPYSFYETNYTYNQNLEGSSMGYIYGQNRCPNFKIGGKYMSDVGCEIAATYNALKHLGRRIPCASIIRTFEKEAYLMSLGTIANLGSDPFAIGDYLDDNSINYTQYTDYNTMQSLVNSGRWSNNVYIVSYWNDDSTIFDGLHTIALYTTTSDSMIHIYNHNENNTSVTTVNTFAEIFEDNDNNNNDTAKFIVGYRIPRPRSN